MLIGTSNELPSEPLEVKTGVNDIAALDQVLEQDVDHGSEKNTKQKKCREY